MKSARTEARAWTLGAGLACVLLGGCGSRPGSWDTQATAKSFGLANGVALVDDADHRVIVLTVDDKHDVHRQPFSIGHNVVATAVSSDRMRLLVLSTGDAPGQGGGEQAKLTVVTLAAGGGVQASSGAASSAGSSAAWKQYAFKQPCTQLAVDPLGRWAVAYQPTGFVANPNQLVIFDLTHDVDPITPTIQSFGGTPKRFTFTPPLLVDPSLGPETDADTPNGDRRLLVVETDRDVTLRDLDHPTRPELTIPLASQASGATVTPAAVVVDGFDKTQAADARLAIRPANGSVVYTIAFAPPNAGDANDFRPTINVTDVGGAPSDFAFVHADDGALRLAVLVPSKTAAVLVDPDVNLVSQVQLPGSFANLSIVTQVVNAGASTDVALLWNGGGATGVALWTLGQAIGQPTFSIDVPGLQVPIVTVDDVPGSALKILEPSDASAFYVLNLASGRLFPLTTTSKATLSIAPDGRRAWAYAKNGTQLSLIDLAVLAPVPLTTDHPISAVYDVSDTDGATRSLIALDLDGNVGGTVYDALAPAAGRSLSSLLLEVP